MHSQIAHSRIAHSRIAHSRIMVVLVLCTMVAAVPGVQAFALSASQPIHPAGCHNHGPAAPAPASYQCCVNGHHWTIPSASFSVRPPLAQFSRSDHSRDFSPVLGFSAFFSMIVMPASSPPGIAPLRI